MAGLSALSYGSKTVVCDTQLVNGFGDNRATQNEVPAKISGCNRANFHYEPPGDRPQQPRARLSQELTSLTRMKL